MTEMDDVENGVEDAYILYVLSTSSEGLTQEQIAERIKSLSAEERLKALADYDS
jgi:hypothetical protein